MRGVAVAGRRPTLRKDGDARRLAASGGTLHTHTHFYGEEVCSTQKLFGHLTCKQTHNKSPNCIQLGLQIGRGEREIISDLFLTNLLAYSQLSVGCRHLG